MARRRELTINMDIFFPAIPCAGRCPPLHACMHGGGPILLAAVSAHAFSHRQTFALLQQVTGAKRSLSRLQRGTHPALSALPPQLLMNQAC